MQLLIVHDDAEVGEQSAGMVADYTEHASERVSSDAAAQEWAQKHARCDLLLAQLDGAAVDGLTLVQAVIQHPKDKAGAEELSAFQPSSRPGAAAPAEEARIV